MFRIILLIFDLLSNFFTPPRILISHINFDYVINLYKYKFQFNIIDKIDNNLNKHLITIRNIKKMIKYFDKINFEDISKKFNDHDLFFVSDKIMRNNIYKFVISNIINTNSYLYIYKNNDKQIKFKNIKKYIKISWRSKLTSNNKNILELFTKYLINLQKRYSFSKKNFYNFEKTMNVILDDNVCRFSDGEFNIMLGFDTNFQKGNKILARDMNDTYLYFSKKEKGRGIAINKKVVFFSNIINDRSLFHEMNCKQDLIENINDIYDANIWSITPYMLYHKMWNYLDKPFCLYINNKNYDIFNQDFYINTKIGLECLSHYNEYFKNWFKKLFSKYDQIILVSNKKNKFFLDLSFFDDKNTNFIETAQTNSFSNFEEIKNKIWELNNKNTLFLISCGPTGKLLCKYIDEIKSRFVDIGNFINYYSYFNKHFCLNKINDVHIPSIINEKEIINQKN